jgi:hypothetical protein
VDCLGLKEKAFLKQMLPHKKHQKLSFNLLLYIPEIIAIRVKNFGCNDFFYHLNNVGTIF